MLSALFLPCRLVLLLSIVVQLVKATVKSSSNVKYRRSSLNEIHPQNLYAANYASVCTGHVKIMHTV